MNKIMSLAIVIVMMTVSTGCVPMVGRNGSGGSEQVVSLGVDGKYTDLLTVTAVRYLPTIVQFADGEDVENNAWTRAFRDKLNIELKYLWTVPTPGEAYDQKINIAIASNDLPDIIPVYTSLYEKLAKADKLHDLTDVLEKYGSEELKKNLEASDSAALVAARRNNQLTGIGILPDTIPGAMVWIREDWRTKLNIEEPKNMDDILNIATAFAENDPDGNGKRDTWGFALDKNLTGISAFFNAYHVYDSIWLDVDGNLKFTSTLPDIKKPLAVLHQLFADGIIDSEFPYKTEGDQIKADIISGRIGMIFGNTSSPLTNLGAAYKSNGVEWKAYPVPSIDDQPIKLQIATRVADFIAVNKTCNNPEALIQMLNLGTEIKYDNPEWITNNDFHTTKEGYMAFFYPPFSFPPDRFGSDISTVGLIEESIQTGDTSMFNQERLAYFKKVKGFIDGTEGGDWGIFKVYSPGGSLSIKKSYKDNDNIMYNEDFLAETPAWVQNGANLVARTREFYTMSIMEGNIDKAYDDYVNYFENQGGAEATNEINALYKGMERLNQ